MGKQLATIGSFDLYIPDELMFDVVTLKIDLRPVFIALQEASPKPHQHTWKRYYKQMKCKGCGTRRPKHRSIKL